MKGGYYLFNGKFYKEDEPVISGFHLSDCDHNVEISFRAEYTSVLFPETIYQHLQKSAQAARIALPDDYAGDDAIFFRDISRLLNKCHLYLGAQVTVRLIALRDETVVILKAAEIPRGFYPLEEPGLLIYSHLENTKSSTRRWTYENACQSLWNAANRKSLISGVKEMIIFNHEGSLCESVGGSFAFIKEDSVFLPSSRTGGYLSPLRPHVIRAITRSGLKAVDKDRILITDLHEAEELFLFDAVFGIRKVLGLDDSRYLSPKSTKIADCLSGMGKSTIPDEGQK